MLFDEITRLPEYYPTAREREILRERADEIARSPARTRSSSSARERPRRRASCSTRSAPAGTLRRFVPFDVSEAVLRDAATPIADDYPASRSHAVVGDFEHHLEQLCPTAAGG